MRLEHMLFGGRSAGGSARAEAFRDDLAARAFVGIQGDSVTFQVTSLAPHPAGAEMLGDISKLQAHPFGFTGSGMDREWRFTHTDGTQFFKNDAAAGESYGAWAMKCAEEAERNRAAMRFFVGTAPVIETDWGSIQVAPASPEKRRARASDLVKITTNVVSGSHDWWADWQRRVANELLGIVESDEPGIAAMAAKNVQPAPEPVLSIAGEQVTERELAQALQLLRGQSAPVGKETPRGLMVVREFDHRLGAWLG